MDAIRGVQRPIVVRIDRIRTVDGDSQEEEAKNAPGVHEVHLAAGVHIATDERAVNRRRRENPHQDRDDEQR